MKLIIILSLLLSGCANLPDIGIGPVTTTTMQTPQATTTTTLPSKPAYLQSWWTNSTEPHPERIEMFQILSSLIDQKLEIFSKATDLPAICPKFQSLDRQHQILTFANFIGTVIYKESAFNPKSWMTETTMDLDSVTGKQVKSEGLLQLSYQDVPNYASIIQGFRNICQIDWSKDKSLDQNDPKKTIFDLSKNLTCGVEIMAYDMTAKHAFGNATSYWAVLRPNGKYTSYAYITSVAKMHTPGCL